MTNISAMQAIAQLNKLMDQRAELQPKSSTTGNSPNSIFTEKKPESNSLSLQNIEHKIAMTQKQVEASEKAENSPIDEVKPGSVE